MNKIYRVYHFLGSIRFAILLIASVAVFVVAGTFLESATNSHRYAAYFTYHNPIFMVLLWGFFVNILISALRRWPFQVRHIPFLITHAGLLMILGGALVKSYFGRQGAMMIIEGSASQEIRKSDTYIVNVEKKAPSSRNPQQTSSLNYSLTSTDSKEGSHYLKPLNGLGEIKIKLMEYSPHSSEYLETWIKGDHGYICGFKPFQVYDWNDPLKDKYFPESTEVNLQNSANETNQTAWKVFAGKTLEIRQIAKQIYLQEMQVILTDAITCDVLFQGPLVELLNQPLVWKDGHISLDLDFSFSSESGFENPKLQMTLNSNQKMAEKILISLQGSDSLLNINQRNRHLGKAAVNLDLQRPQALLLLEDNKNAYVFAYDANGQVFSEIFPKSNLNSLVVYDRGFGGYAVQAQFPIMALPSTRQARENAILHHLKVQLENGQKSSSQLSPPLEMLHTACVQQGMQFADHCVEFLTYWNNRSCWLISEDQSLPKNIVKIVNSLNWQMISDRDRKGCYWAHVLFLELERRLDDGQELRSALSSMNWPLMKQDNLPEDDAELLTLLTQQVFSVADHLPDEEIQVYSPTMNARMLSAYFRAYTLHLSNLITPASTTEMQEFLQDYFVAKGYNEQDFKFLQIESPLTAKHHQEVPQNKLEENIPKVTLEISKGKRKEWITLAYDRYGQGLKWPVFDGEYLLRFQPEFETIPYRVRLRNARQINYANSTQPFSYESDLIITDRERHSVIEKTISMNNVHETWQGHRFYLASIAPSHEGVVKSVQIIVNHDPAKYFLTYPGALFLTLGIFLLFWMKPYSKKSNL